MLQQLLLYVEGTVLPRRFRRKLLLPCFLCDSEMLTRMLLLLPLFPSLQLLLPPLLNLLLPSKTLLLLPLLLCVLLLLRRQATLLYLPCC